MITTTQQGELYRKKFSEEIEATIKAVNERWNTADPEEDRKFTEKDFCIFVRNNGYMVVLIEAYTKMSKTKKKFIERSYEYRQIPE